MPATPTPRSTVTGRSPGPAADSARAVIGRLVRPLYLPSALYSVGTGAAIPAQVLVGLSIGLDAGAVALALTLSGVVMVAGTAATGPVVERWGERAALVGSTAAAVLAVAALVVAVAAGTGQLPAYLVALAVFNLTDGVWGVARQELMAQWIPAAVRGRAVNTYGASQRVGRLVGPFVAGALILAVGPVAGFVVFAVAAVIGCVAILTAPAPVAPAPDGPLPQPLPEAGRAPETAAAAAASSSVPSATPSRPAGHPRIPAGVWAGFWVVGLSVLALSVLRINQEVLLPLWAAGVVHLPDARVSFAMGVWMALELALFLPAGAALDRWGPLPVALTCLVGLTAGFALLLVPGGFWPAIVVLGLAGGTGSGIVKTLGLILAPAVGRPRFLGRWMALATVGTVVAPGLVALTQRASLTASVLVTVAVGLAGALWLATAGRRYLAPRLAQAP